MRMEGRKRKRMTKEEMGFWPSFGSKIIEAASLAD